MGNTPNKAAELGKHVASAAARAAKDAASDAAARAQRAALAVERQGALPRSPIDMPIDMMHAKAAEKESAGLASAQSARVTGVAGAAGGDGGGGGKSRDAADPAAIADLYRRANERPALFRRLDEPDAGPVEPAVLRNTIGLDDEAAAAAGVGAGGGDAAAGSERSDRPLDPEGAEVAAAVQRATGQAVSVQRVRPSADVDLSPDERAALHAKNAATVANVESLDGAVQAQPGDPAGRAALAVWDAMQLNPKLLDSPEALARSHGQLLLAQMALGYVPPDARGDLTPEQAEAARRAAPPALPLLGAGGSGGAGSAKALTDGGQPSSDSQHQEGLVPLAERIDALVPAGRTLDELILAQPPPAGVAAWGPRPPEGSPYDQLILVDPDEPAMLDRNELFEMYARHRADPAYWTPERLASYYDTSA
jgi:hypothetical protein